MTHKLARDLEDAIQVSLAKSRGLASSLVITHEEAQNISDELNSLLDSHKSQCEALLNKIDKLSREEWDTINHLVASSACHDVNHELLLMKLLERSPRPPEPEPLEPPDPVERLLLAATTDPEKFTFESLSPYTRPFMSQRKIKRKKTDEKQVSQ